MFCYHNNTPKPILLPQHSSDLGYFVTLLFGSGSLKNMVSGLGLCHWIPFGSTCKEKWATFFSPRVLVKSLISWKASFRLTLNESGTALNQQVHRSL